MSPCVDIHVHAKGNTYLVVFFFPVQLVVRFLFGCEEEKKKTTKNMDVCFKQRGGGEVPTLA